MCAHLKCSVIPNTIARLRDGRSIHTVSALLLQLVQTSAHDVRIEARKLALSRQQSVVLKRNDSSFVEGTETFLTERDREVGLPHGTCHNLWLILL